MIHRNRRGSRVKAAVAAAVLVGGGAAGAVAVAVNHGGASTAAESAAFAKQYHQTISEPTALLGAMNGWHTSQSHALTMLAEMKPMRTFSQVRFHHTQLAAQRGVVVLATKQFLVVKSANGSLHLWWLTRGTVVKNVTANATGLMAMTGSSSAAAAAMTSGSMNSAAKVMAGSSTAVNSLTRPAAAPDRMKIATGNEVVTITISWNTAKVTQPGATPSTSPSATPSASASATPTVTVSATPSASATTTQPVTMTTQGVARGDLVFVVGEREHGKLIAKLVFFAAPKVAVTPTATPSASVSTSASATPTITPTATSSATVTPTATSTAPTIAPTPTGTGSTPPNLAPHKE